MSDLSPEAQRKWGNLPHLTKRTSSEWSAACPSCGEGSHMGNDKPDRFRIKAPVKHGEQWRGFCRRCGFFEFVDQGERQKPLTVVEIVQARQERARLQKAEQERLRAKIESLQTEAYWRGWHDAMTTVHRQLWHQQGIPDYFIDYYSLGYCADHPYNWDGQTHHSPSLTIPHWDFDKRIVNIQHRLLNPAKGAGKYRQTAGLPAAMFITDLDADKLENRVLVVEGAKKAIVTYMHLGSQLDGKDFSVVGVPSKTPGKALLSKLSECELIYLALDPDAYFGPNPAAMSVAQELGRERVRLVRLPVKPDDFFTEYDGECDQFKAFMRNARVVV